MGLPSRRTSPRNEYREIVWQNNCPANSENRDHAGKAAATCGGSLSHESIGKVYINPTMVMNGKTQR